jgi:ATP-binding cassette subfamily B protein
VFSDPENERLIQKAFERLMKNKAVIMIAHRLSTVRGADRIIVIDKGRVARIGVREELPARGGRCGDMRRACTETASRYMATSEREDAGAA